MNYAEELIDFLHGSPTAFQAVDSIEKLLKENGFEEIEGDFPIKKGRKYYLKRNGTSIMAFTVGKDLKDPSLHACASHTDCPALKLKPEGLMKRNGYVLANVEVYGGPLIRTWFDRPLGLSGRVLVKTRSGIRPVLFSSEEVFALIPSVAPHMQRDEDKAVDRQTDLQALVSLKEDVTIRSYLSEKMKEKEENILSYDLFLHPFEKGRVWGRDGEFISCDHLDDLECGYATLKGFLEAENKDNINIYLCFDNEEVGSLTRQGADSDFFSSTLDKICAALKLDRYELLKKGMMLSCDNGHAAHPNHMEYADPVNAPRMNKGLIIKYNANQSYTSDGLGSALLADLMDRREIPYQYYTNRSNIRGGGTLGNLSNRHVSLLSVDIGLPQLAMHSINETGGSEDIKALIDLCRSFYSSHLQVKKDVYKLR